MKKDIVLVSIYLFKRKDITTMKKVLFSAATALMLTAMTAIPALAAGSENWVAGPGFISNGSEDGEYPVTITETDAGIQVSHGGYYQTGENWGGAAYLVPIELDGARVEITLDKFPEGNQDCWFSVDFLTKPELFYAGDNFSDNPGIVNLIRFATPQFQAFGPDSFTLIANTDDEAFALAQGEQLVVEILEADDNTYQLVVNDVICGGDFDLTEISPDGKAYLVISGSQVDATATDNFVYTITSVNGQPTVIPDAPEAEAPADDAADAPAADAPATADAGIVAAAALAAASAAVVFSKKRR